MKKAMHFILKYSNVRAYTDKDQKNFDLRGNFKNGFWTGLEAYRICTSEGRGLAAGAAIPAEILIWPANIDPNFDLGTVLVCVTAAV